MHKKIKQIREHEKLSQEKFGARIGATRDTIANIEVNRIEIKDIHIKSICREFKVDEDWLRNGDGEIQFVKRTKNHEIAEFINTVMELPDESFQKRFANGMAKLDIEDWKAIEKIVNKILKEG